MKTEKNHIDNWLQQSAAGGHVPVNEAHWQRMRALLEHKKRRRFFFIWWLAGAVVLAVVGVWTYFHYQKTDRAKKGTIEGRETSNKKAAGQGIMYAGISGIERYNGNLLTKKNGLLTDTLFTNYINEPVINEEKYEFVYTDTSGKAGHANLITITRTNKEKPGKKYTDAKRDSTGGNNKIVNRRNRNDQQQQTSITKTKKRNLVATNRINAGKKQVKRKTFQNTTTVDLENKREIYNINQHTITVKDGLNGEIMPEPFLLIGEALTVKEYHQPDSLTSIPGNYYMKTTAAIQADSGNTNRIKSSSRYRKHQYSVQGGYGFGNLPVRATGVSLQTGYQYNISRHWNIGATLSAGYLRIREQQTFNLVQVKDIPGSTFINLHTEQKVIKPANGWLVAPSVYAGFRMRNLEIAAGIRAGKIISGANQILRSNSLDTMTLRSIGWTNTNNTYNEKNFTGRSFGSYELNLRYYVYRKLYIGGKLSRLFWINNSGLFINERCRSGMVFFTGISF